jgi:hypothetical protein
MRRIAAAEKKPAIDGKKVTNSRRPKTLFSLVSFFTS